ncbi:hypothetical protein, conserved [Trypanosoma brucei brucei TREU927]|uniref:BILBO1 N-terminal domain-containing protein n=1 Tax=Trypanosoma brucei brucei (strain 927/4 GUTat10.1) TaxID=185431 RepID=Q38B39_TRYB2|nr:hypothetical protein, conserved [Trypanosoma brucei brucei TREU927]EAN77981.1 hypothetical protein, conserved [Trypanosoma brucei brucei TREU927]
MYPLLVCADLYGEKYNLEVRFPSKPTIEDLQKRIVTVFSTEMDSRRPEGYPEADFSIALVHIYDDKSQQWEKLLSDAQLHEYDQLYVFQPQTRWHMDVQKNLPPPTTPSKDHRTATPHSICKSPQSKGCDDVYSFSQNCEATVTAKTRLEEQRRRERVLREELFRVREETERLEREAALELSRKRLLKWQVMYTSTSHKETSGIYMASMCNYPPLGECLYTVDAPKPVSPGR